MRTESFVADGGGAHNPLDLVERLAESQHWIFDRSPSELNMRIDGGWSDLSLSLTWRDDLETLHVAATFDMRIPAARRDEARKLIGLVNEQLFHGHFDMWNADGTLVFRNSLILAGGAAANDAQCHALIDLAVIACKRYFPSVQFVVWGGRSAADALDASLLETVGEA